MRTPVAFTPVGSLNPATGNTEGNADGSRLMRIKVSLAMAIAAAVLAVTQSPWLPLA